MKNMYSFKKSDIGKTILIKDRSDSSAVKIGNSYLIIATSSDGGAHLQNTDRYWYAANIEAFQFVNTKNEDIEIGDTVIIVKDTTTLKEGEEKKVTGFVCEDKNKIVVEGIIPGGWIDVKKMVKKVDLSRYRTKKAIELMKEYGLDFYTRLYLNSTNSKIFGKTFDELGVVQYSSSLKCIKLKGVQLSDFMYTDKPYEQIEIIVLSEKDIPGNQSNNKIEKSKIANKKLSEVLKKFNEEDDESVLNLSLLFCNDGQINVSGYYLVNTSIKIVKKTQNEETNLVVVNPL